MRSVFGWLLVINGLLFLAYFFGGTLIAIYFDEPRLELLAKVLAFVFLLAPFRVIPNALLDRNLKFKLRAFAEFIASTSAAIATLVLAILGAGVWALVAGMLINRVLLAIILMIMQPWIIAPSLSFSAVRTMMVFGGTLSLGGAVVLITDKLATLIAGPILGAELLGIFAVTFQFALLPLAKIMPVINPIIFPAFSKFQEQRDVAAHYLGKSLGIVSLGLFPIMIGLACISQEFVATVLGDKWSAVAVPLALLSIVMPFRMTTSFLRPVLASMGRPDLSLKSTIIALLTLIAPNIDWRSLRGDRSGGGHNDDRADRRFFHYQHEQGCSGYFFHKNCRKLPPCHRFLGCHGRMPTRRKNHIWKPDRSWRFAHRHRFRCAYLFSDAANFLWEIAGRCNKTIFGKAKRKSPA